MDMPFNPDTSRMVASSQAAHSAAPQIGLAGNAVPVELVIAAGCVPFAVMARAEDFDADSAPMEEGHEPEVRSLFLQALAGAFDHCAMLVVPSTSDGHRYLFQYLKEMQRQGAGERIPPLECYDFLFGASAAVRRYSRRVLRGLAERLGVLTGSPVSDGALRNAIAQTNAVRSAIARLDGLRRSGHIAGAEAHAAIRASGYVEPLAYRRALDAWIGGLPAAAPLAGRARLLVISAVPLYHERLHQACEAAGANVVAEDDEWGTRRGVGQVDTAADPLDALFAHYSEHAVSPRMLQPQREAWVRATMAAGGLDGVLFYVPPSDQFFGWRYPALKHAADACGLPTLLVRDEVLDAAAVPAITAGIATFVQQLKGPQ
jgi:benzoyl-CoA reductase/2-hydroxyglutaryl-CoA dehydratase subunit BcrC/BadD/HgdB